MKKKTSDITHFLIRSRVSVVGVVTVYGLDDRGGQSSESQ
jgi:hypothetical protein